MDDSTKSLTSGERGQTAIMRPAPHLTHRPRHAARRRPRRVALAGAAPDRSAARPGRLALSALLLLVAVAFATPAWSQTPTTLIKNTEQPEDAERPFISVAYAQEFSTGAYPDGYTLTNIAILLTGIAPNSATRASVWTTSMSGLPDVKQFDLTSPPSLLPGGNHFTAPANSTLDASQTYALVLVKTAGAFQALQTNTNEDAGGAAGWSITDSWPRIGGGETVFSTFRTGKALRIDITGYTNFPAIAFRGVSGLSVSGDVIGHVSFPEDVGTAVLTVDRDGTPTTALSVPWSTADNTAVSPDDYAGGQGTLTFAPGETEQTISVPIVDDAAREDPVRGVPESFFVDLEPGDNYNLKHRGAVGCFFREVLLRAEDFRPKAA